MKKIVTFAALVMAAGLGLTSCANPDDAASAANDVKATQTAVAADDAIAAMVPENIRKNGTFTAAVNPDVPPVKFVDANGKITGLTPELLEAAAQVMGLKMELQQSPFDALVPGLNAQRFEVVLSIGDFKERQAQIDFIDYIRQGTAILVPASSKSTALTPDQLCGLRVGHARGTREAGLLEKATAACAAEGKPALTASGYQDLASAIIGVKSGQEDAVWGDSVAMLYNAGQNPDLYKVVYTALEGPYGIGINKENHEFRDALQAALKKLATDGVYDELLAKWGLTDLAMPEFPLNTGPYQNG